MGSEVIGTYASVETFATQRVKLVRCAACQGVRKVVTMSFIVGIAIIQTGRKLAEKHQEVAAHNAELDSLYYSSAHCTCANIPNAED